MQLFKAELINAEPDVKQLTFIYLEDSWWINYVQLEFYGRNVFDLHTLVSHVLRVTVQFT